MRYFLEFILKRLVEHIDDVDVRQIDAERTITFQVSVHPEDVGRVIGKSGRTISAIRGLLNAAASKTNSRVAVQLFENSAL
jgi:uncharacterized protein